MTVIEIRDYTRMCLTYSELSKACAIAPRQKLDKNCRIKWTHFYLKLWLFVNVTV